MAQMAEMVEMAGLYSLRLRNRTQTYFWVSTGTFLVVWVVQVVSMAIVGKGAKAEKVVNNLLGKLIITLFLSN
jgi:uncharacterized membrane protein YGL010W